MKRLISSVVCLVVLASCSYVPEDVQVSYQPVLQAEPLAEASAVNVDIQVVDNRRDGKRVSRKKDAYGIELASIRLEGDLTSTVYEAMKAELQNLGFPIASGNVEVEVDIQKFYNDFKPGFFYDRGISELLLGVTVKKKNGHIIYSKNIVGIGEVGDVWRHSGKNAKVALDSALKDAIEKVLRDRSFIQALIKNSEA